MSSTVPHVSQVLRHTHNLLFYCSRIVHWLPIATIEMCVTLVLHGAFRFREAGTTRKLGSSIPLRRFEALNMRYTRFARQRAARVTF